MNEIKEIESIAEATLAWSHERNFQGYNKHDGLNSPIFKALLGWSKWARIIAIQIVTRAPINLRPFLLIPPSPNPKGLSLFLRGVLSRFNITKDESYRETAKEILNQIKSLRKPSGQGEGWGYYYPWQDPGFYALPGMPNAVVTSFVCHGLMDAFECFQDEEYLADTSIAIDFFFKALPILKNEPKELCLGYMPVPMEMRVMDVSILIATVVARYNQLANKDIYSHEAYRLANYVVNRQTSEGAWFYTDPPGDSHITHDNYHTGFILDALEDYMGFAKDLSWKDQHKKGLMFYQQRLFNEDGSPRWMHDKNYPYDIHGAAQGVITFSRHESIYPGFSDKVLSWTIENMYHPDGRFYYQKQKYFRKKFTLMRWCNAWMYYALSRWLENKHLES